MSLSTIIEIINKLRFVKEKELILPEDHNNLVDLYKEVYNYLVYFTQNIQNIVKSRYVIDTNYYRLDGSNTFNITAKNSIASINSLDISLISDYNFLVQINYTDSTNYARHYIFCILYIDVLYFEQVCELDNTIQFFMFSNIDLYSRYTALYPMRTNVNVSNIVFKGCQKVGIDSYTISSNVYNVGVSGDGKYVFVIEALGINNNNISIKVTRFSGE